MGVSTYIPVLQTVFNPVQHEILYLRLYTFMVGNPTLKLFRKISKPEKEMVGCPTHRRIPAKGAERLN